MSHTISVTLPDGWTAFQVAIKAADAPELVAALCAIHGYESHILDDDGVEILNPMPPNEFANKVTREKFLAPTIQQYRSMVAVAKPTPEMASITDLNT